MQRADDVFLAGGRVARYQKHARAAQRHGILKARLTQIRGRNLTGQRHRAHGVDAGLQPQMIHPGRQFHVAGADRLAFGG